MHAHKTPSDADLSQRLNRLHAAAEDEAARILQEPAAAGEPNGQALRELDAEIARARFAAEEEAPALAPSGSSRGEGPIASPRGPSGRTALLNPNEAQAPGLLSSSAAWIGLAAALLVAFIALRSDDSAEPSVAATEGEGAGAPVYMGGAPDQEGQTTGEPSQGNPIVADYAGTVDFSGYVESRPPFKVFVIDVTRDVKIDDLGRSEYEVFDTRWSHDPTFDPPLPKAFRFEVHMKGALHGAQPLWQQLYSVQ